MTKTIAQVVVAVLFAFGAVAQNEDSAAIKKIANFKNYFFYILLLIY
jgi:hypothetical protein